MADLMDYHSTELRSLDLSASKCIAIGLLACRSIEAVILATVPVDGIGDISAGGSGGGAFRPDMESMAITWPGLILRTARHATIV